MVADIVFSGEKQSLRNEKARNHDRAQQTVEEVAKSCVTVEERRFSAPLGGLKSMGALAPVLRKWGRNDFLQPARDCWAEGCVRDRFRGNERNKDILAGGGI